MAGSPSGSAVQALEGLLRSAIFKPATEVVASLLQATADRIDANYKPQPGEQRKGREAIQVQCLFGIFTLWRYYVYDPSKRQGHHPVDEVLGLENGYTPALSRLVSLEGADENGYEKAQLHLREIGGIEVDARQIHRVVQRVGPDAQKWALREENSPKEAIPILYVGADATGVPMRAEELIGRAGRQPDGTAKTRYAYLGCVFTQHRRDADGHPIRDYESTTYVSLVGSLAEFAPILRKEAIRRGMAYAVKVVLLIDGAEGLEHMGELYFLGCVQIVDFFHAMEHAGLVLTALLGSREHPDFHNRLSRWAKRLLRNGVDRLVAETRLECVGKPDAKVVEKELGYFIRNSKRMQYGTFRKAGYFIGSGVIEAGCKTIIGSRCKHSGMHWGVPGAQNVLSLRCVHANHRLDDFWKSRLDSRLPPAA